MAVYPTNTEITTLINSTYNSGTNTASGYQVANNESPILSSKQRGLIIASQQLIGFNQNTQNARNNQRCVLRTANFSHNSSGNFLTIPFGSGATVYDPADMHSETTNNSRILLPATGVYMAYTIGKFADNTTGLRAIRFRRNSGNIVTSPNSQELGLYDNADAGGRWTKSSLLIFNGSIGDIMEVQYRQDSGGTLTLEYAYLVIERYDV